MLAITLLLVASIQVVQAPVEGSAPPATNTFIQELIARLHEAGCRLPQASAVQSEADASVMSKLVLERRLSDSDWQQALLTTGVIVWRKKWPQDQPFALSMRSPRWLDGRITLNPRMDGWRSAEVGELLYTCAFTSRNFVSAHCQELGRLPVGIRELNFDVVVQRRGLDLLPAADCTEVLWRGSLSLPIEPVEFHDQALPPVRDELLDEAVRSSLGAGLCEGHMQNTKARTWFVVLDPDLGIHPELARVGLSLTIDVLRDNEIIETVKLLGSDCDPWLASNSLGDECGSYFTTANLESVHVRAEENPKDLDRYRLRVRGDAMNTLLLWHAQTYWAGEIVVPLRELMEQEKKRLGFRGRWHIPHF